jgi:hypothetical protein
MDTMSVPYDAISGSKKDGNVNLLPLRRIDPVNYGMGELTLRRIFA